jgi:hypothetical protein
LIGLIEWSTIWLRCAVFVVLLLYVISLSIEPARTPPGSARLV